MGNDLHFETFPLLETERLILRELRPEDAEAVFRILSDAEVVRYYDPLMIHLEQAQRSIERHRARFENNEGILLWTHAMEFSDLNLTTNAKQRLPIPNNDGPGLI